MPYEGATMNDGLVDDFGRRISYLRVSVTERCDLRCRYCLPKGYSAPESPGWLTAPEIERLVRLFVSVGVSHVRLTGGEPLVRPDLVEVAERLGVIDGLQDLSLSTNALRLAPLAQPLHAAGISRINVSLDSLRPERFREITGGRLDKVLKGLDAAREVGFAPIKLNMVVLEGTNDDEVEAMVDFCLDKGFALRFIEAMPVGDTGRGDYRRDTDLVRLRERLERRFTLLPDVMPGGGPARYLRVAGTELRIGFITPISQHFCDTCNRVRLTADGILYLCLGSEHAMDLGGPLRAGADDGELVDMLKEAIHLKPERHLFNEQPTQVVRFMAQTGG